MSEKSTHGVAPMSLGPGPAGWVKSHREEEVLECLGPQKCLLGFCMCCFILKIEFFILKHL